ncbi:MAG: biotin--[acetyl-CoA-carboxylase] ligase [Leptospirillia bacterium]
MSPASEPNKFTTHPPAAGHETAGRLVELLRAAGDGFVSGSRLGRELKVSRTAVWKHIKALESEGYGIVTHPRHGYRLAHAPEALHPREVASALSSRWLGSRMVVWQSVDSTNRAAMEDAGLGHGAVVAALCQPSGRGRLGRTWNSPPGSLPFSVVLSPGIPLEHMQTVTLATALGLAQGIEAATGVRVGIKWPNDLIWEGRKLAGILTEARSDPDRVVRSVVGVGLNVTTRTDDFPPELQARAASLEMAGGRDISASSLLAALLNALEPVYDAVLSAGRAGRDAVDVMHAYRERCITLGRTVTVSGASGQPIYGEAVEVDATGALWIRPEGCEPIRVLSGDVTLNPDGLAEAGR